MKERLLGAAVLIIAAVILIPTLLDGPTEPGRMSQELELPGAGAVAGTKAEITRTHTVNVSEQPGRQRATEIPQPDVPEQTLAKQAPISAAPPAPVPAAVRDTTSAAPVAVSPKARGGWAVQVGSFSSESNARRLVEHLRESDYPAFVVRNVVSGRVMFRVRVGPEADRTRAEALAERLQADRQQTQIVSHP